MIIYFLDPLWISQSTFICPFIDSPKQFRARALEGAVKLRIKMIFLAVIWKPRSIPGIFHVLSLLIFMDIHCIDCSHLTDKNIKVQRSDLPKDTEIAYLLIFIFFWTDIIIAFSFPGQMQNVVTIQNV